MTSLTSARDITGDQWVWVLGLKTEVLLKCLVVDLPQNKDRPNLQRRGIVVELKYESAKLICGSVVDPPRQCPVLVRIVGPGDEAPKTRGRVNRPEHPSGYPLAPLRHLSRSLVSEPCTKMCSPSAVRKRGAVLTEKMFLAFDPGGTTGFASGYHYDKEFVLVESGEISWTDRFTVFDVIRGYRSQCNKLCVIIEDFMPAPDAYPKLVQRHVLASEVIGMIDLSCNLLRLTTPIRQQPSVRKSVMVLEKHKGVIGSSNHRRDSYQHLRYAILGDIRRPHR